MAQVSAFEYHVLEIGQAVSLLVNQHREILINSSMWFPNLGTAAMALSKIVLGMVFSPLHKMDQDSKNRWKVGVSGL